MLHIKLWIKLQLYRQQCFDALSTTVHLLLHNNFKRDFSLPAKTAKTKPNQRKKDILRQKRNIKQQRKNNKRNEAKEEMRLKQIRLAAQRHENEGTQSGAQKASTSFSEQGVCLQDIRNEARMEETTAKKLLSDSFNNNNEKHKKLWNDWERILPFIYCCACKNASCLVKEIE